MKFARPLAALLSILLLPAGSLAATFVVDSTLDASDAAAGNGVCATAGAQCTLRAALQEANALAGADAIHFNIDGGGLQTIAPATPLPAISTAISIDGTTQPGFAGVPLIELNGIGAGPAVSGLAVTAAGSGSISGLIINRFSASGILVASTGALVLTSNYIGTDSTGTSALGNFRGISLQGASNVQVGDGVAGHGNVISGNADGIFISSAASLNSVMGNFIGTDASGTLSVANGGGINIFNASNNVLGGALASQGNVVSGNSAFGIVIQGLTAVGNEVAGNRIGTQANGTSALGNVGPGIWLRNGAAAAMTAIGGLLPGEGNVIAFNTIGIDLSGSAPSLRNSFLGNSIHSNSQMGIDIDGGGVAANDAGDADGGSNGLQNFPVVSSVFATDTSVEISGSLSSEASTAYHLEFFASAVCDPSGYGEGETFLGSFDGASDAGGILDFSQSFPGSLPAGAFVTATATDSDGNTSEFSACAEAPGCPGAPEVGCLAGFGSAKLSASEKKAGKESVKITWSKGPAFDGDQLGNPLASGGTVYFVCIYDGTDTLVQQYTVGRAGDSCGSRPCWANVGPALPGDSGHKGYKYKDASITADGISNIALRPGVAGKTKASVKGRNNVAKGQTTLPTGVAQALSGSTSVIVQLLGSDASVCLEETLNNVSKDDGLLFKASK